MFEKYIHLERLGHPATDGILEGMCYVFEKMDGTNGSIWLEDGQIKAGSRNRELSDSQDNHNFYKYVKTDANLVKFLSEFPGGTIVYGEWMVPHTIKDYPSDLWHTFQIFDVNVNGEYLPYSEWDSKARDAGVNFLKPLYESANLSIEKINELASSCKEGIVIKNYNFINKFKQYTSAKVINPNFAASPGSNNKPIKEKDKRLEYIVEKYLTAHLILKTRDKLQDDAFDRKKLINLVWYDFLQEDLFQIIESEKNLVIDFRELKNLVIQKIKRTLPELF